MTGPPGGRRLTVLFAPDSFKGSVTSIEVARALAAGWARARPADEQLLAPLADGGEGTLEALYAAGGWERVAVEVADPLGRPVQATWLRSTDGRTAAVEMAQASGLSRLGPDERDPIHAKSFGTGQIIDHALGAGVEKMVLGIGGSATTDGGMGLLFALGARPIPGTPDSEWDLSGLSPALSRVDLSVACDVTNPLLGPAGAAATYGPQKGATPPQIAQLDETLTGWADRLERAAGRRERDTPGAGAAGGVGFGLLAIQDRFRSFALRPGIDLVMEATGFDDKLARADLVITGEGRIDAQTAFGKTALGVARRAHARGVPCIAVGGGVTPEGIEALRGLAVAVPVGERPQTVEDAMAAGSEPIERCGERLAALVTIGVGG